MPYNLETARTIFPETRAADVVPATIARFNQLSAEDQLALISGVDLVCLFGNGQNDYRCGSWSGQHGVCGDHPESN